MSSSNGLAVIQQGEIVAVDEWTDQRKEFIRKAFCGGADDVTAGTFLALCERRRLSPEARHVYLVNRAAQGKAPNWVIQTGIDGYRLIADRTGRYAGSDDPVFEYGKDTRPVKATVTVHKLVSGVVGSFTASARWDEYAANSPMWNKMPHTMLAKCFDVDTEVLTERGFQRFSEVTSRVLQVTDRGLEPTYSVPFAQAYDGPMIALESDDLNFCVTPNHDMVTTDGKIEAGAMFEDARARAKHRIPRLVKGNTPDAPVSDQQIQLTAAYLADGHDRAGGTFRIEVSRWHKVDRLRELGGYIAEADMPSAGTEAVGSTRTVVTKLDKVRFSYTMRDVAYLCEVGKRIRLGALMTLSPRQARLFVDTLICFDGHTQAKTGVRRFYTSRLEHLEAFEVAAVMSGLAVSTRKTRYSDLSPRPNFVITVSDKDAIPVRRWGREYHKTSRGNGRGDPGLVEVPNVGGQVWCVTVPSGVIVVRRRGFSMLCGNCAEALALRKAFPEELSGMYTDAEMDQAEAPVAARSEDPTDVAQTRGRRLAAAEPNAITAPAKERIVDWTAFWADLRKRNIDGATYESIVGKKAPSFSDPQEALDALKAAEDAIADDQGDAIDGEFEEVDGSQAAMPGMPGDHNHYGK